MKKITALAAALAIALSLAACGDSSNTSLIGKLIGQGANTNNSSSAKSNTEITQNDKKINDVIGDKDNIEAVATAKAEKITVTETAIQNAGDFSEEKKSFKFNGGNVEYVEYTYYILDEYGYTTEYISFSAKVKLDHYPNSEKSINDVLNDIGNAPSAEVLAASEAPESIEYGMMSEHNQISSVYAENNLLFVTVYYYLWDGGGGTSLSLIGYDTIYIFDIKTGKQLKCEQVFKNFDAVKKLVVQYADEYIKENIPYEVYSQEPYFEQLVDYEWYNGGWKYDGENFTVSYSYLFEGYMYKNIYVDIPADVIRPYFDFESKRPESGSVSKLADIVGLGVHPDYAPAPDIDVNAVLADISREKREELIKDLKYSVGMLEAIHGTTNSLFYDDKRLLGTAYNGYNDSYFYDTYYRTFQDMFYNIRNCFSEDFVSDEEIENITGGINTFVAFGFSPQTIAWEFCPPDPGNPYDFDNAGVVMYSDTEAEVWVAGSAALEATFYVEIFKMVRLDTYGSWKIDKMWIANNGDIDNKWEIYFYY